MTKIDVLMPAYNAASYIEEAIESILNQSFSDLRLIILDDGSTDSTIDLVERLSKKDRRIVIEKNTTNLGIPATRDKLLFFGAAPYLAWMDGDDIAYPQRLKLQYDFMEENPHIGAVSCAFRKMESGQIVLNPQSPEEVKANLLLKDVVCNPGSFLRRSVAHSSGLSYVGTGLPSATDYAYWVAFSRIANIANLPDVLIDYREHTSQESTKHCARQVQSHHEIVKWQFRELDIELTDAPAGLLKLKTGDTRTKQQVEEVGDIFLQAMRANNQHRIYKSDALKTVLAIAFRGHCRRVGIEGLVIFSSFFGMREILKGKNLGFNFIKDCLFTRI